MALTSIPIVSLQTKLDKTEKVLISILHGHGFGINKEHFLCKPIGLGMRIDEGLDYIP